MLRRAAAVMKHESKSIGFFFKRTIMLMSQRVVTVLMSMLVHTTQVFRASIVLFAFVLMCHNEDWPNPRVRQSVDLVCQPPVGSGLLCPSPC